MSFDYKKEYKKICNPKTEPEIIDIPTINYVAVRGSGNPNDPDGEYVKAVGIIYAIAYTIKMSYKGEKQIEGFFDYVVPPLEGFWWQKDIDGVDYSNKDTFNWISIIRLPEFVTEEVFEWAVQETSRKKKIDCSKAEFLTIEEGTCVQIMHYGTYDEEPATVEKMCEFVKNHGYTEDFSDTRLHHEVYLSDPRKTAPEKCRTIIRHPVKKVVQ